MNTITEENRPMPHQEIVASRSVEQSRKRVFAGHHFDPLRFHGAWIYLCVAVAAGTLIGHNHGVERGMLVGTGFVGGFMFLGALTARSTRRGREAIIGAVLMLVMPIGAFLLGGSNSFLWVIGGAALLAAGALVVAHRKGFLATSSVALGTAALSMAAPAAAIGAGANSLAAFVLYGMLWPYFCWRTLAVSHDRKAPRPLGKRPNLRQRGLREAALVTSWAFVAVVVVRRLAL